MLYGARVVAEGRATRAGVVRADDLTFGFEIIEDLIMDGDVVVVRRQETAEDGETVVALLMSGTAPAR